MGEIRSGDLDRRVVLRIYSAGTRSGTLKEIVKTYTDIEAWAQKLDVSDAERVNAMAVGAEVTTRWRIRNDAAWAALDAQDEVVFGGRTYAITGRKEFGDRNEGIELTTVAKIDT